MDSWECRPFQHAGNRFVEHPTHTSVATCLGRVRVKAPQCSQASSDAPHTGTEITDSTAANRPSH